MIIERLKRLWNARCHFCRRWTSHVVSYTNRFVCYRCAAIISAVSDAGKAMCVVCEGTFPERTLSYRTGEARCVTHEVPA